MKKEASEKAKEVRVPGAAGGGEHF